MLTEREREQAAEFLLQFPDSDLKSLVASLTNNMISTQNKEEAINIIIAQTTSLRSLLERKKVTKERIFHYCMLKQIPNIPSKDKPSMITKLMEFWANSNNNSQMPINPLEFAHQFIIWFYKELNEKVFFESNHFWNNAHCSFKIIVNNDYMEKEFTGAENITRMLFNLKHKYKLYFKPNIDEQSIRGKYEVHGMIAIASCGILLHNIQNYFALFDINFLVSSDPVTNKWKINMINIIIKNVSAFQQSPQLMYEFFNCILP